MLRDGFQPLEVQEGGAAGPPLQAGALLPASWNKAENVWVFEYSCPPAAKKFRLACSLHPTTNRMFIHAAEVEAGSGEPEAGNMCVMGLQLDNYVPAGDGVARSTSWQGDPGEGGEGSSAQRKGGRGHRPPAGLYEGGAAAPCSPAKHRTCASAPCPPGMQVWCTTSRLSRTCFQSLWVGRCGAERSGRPQQAAAAAAGERCPAWPGTSERWRWQPQPACLLPRCCCCGDVEAVRARA
jgi:hypothetical protein